MKLSEFSNKLTKELRCVDLSSPELDVRLLCQYGLNISENEYYLEKNRLLNHCEMEEILELIKRRKKFEPVAKITGMKEFWGYKFKVSNKVLDPRPDSEILIESFIKSFEELSFDKNKQYRLLDLGCGSGCLIISLLKIFDNITGVGVDISSDALLIANENAKLNSVIDRVEFKLSNWDKNLDEKFDFIISNPPYIKTDNIAKLMPDVRNYDPLLALDGGDDGLAAYRKICGNIANIAHKNSLLLFEIGHDQADSVSQIMSKNKIINNIKCDLFRDYADKDRCIRGYIK